MRLLAERGRTVHVAVEKGERGEGAGDLVRRLSDQFPTVTQGVAPTAADEWTLFRRKVRLGIDHLPYLRARYRNAPLLLERLEVDALAGVRRAF